MAPPSACGLEAKNYILAAFTAGFIAAAIVTIVFVVLSPARICFSVTSASSHDLGTGRVQLNLTISANNTSRRAAVLYRSMYVDVSNGTGSQWVDWVRADLAALPLEQPRRSEIKMNANVTLLGDITVYNKTSHSFSVRLTAVARFKVGVVCTRLYDIKVMCAPVDFFAKNSTIIDVACE